jgi:hypothetical protein
MSVDDIVLFGGSKAEYEEMKRYCVDIVDIPGRLKLVGLRFDPKKKTFKLLDYPVNEAFLKSNNVEALIRTTCVNDTFLGTPIRRSDGGLEYT